MQFMKKISKEIRLCDSDCLAEAAGIHLHCYGVYDGNQQHHETYCK